MILLNRIAVQGDHPNNKPSVFTSGVLTSAAGVSVRDVVPAALLTGGKSWGAYEWSAMVYFITTSPVPRGVSGGLPPPVVCTSRVAVLDSPVAWRGCTISGHLLLPLCYSPRQGRGVKHPWKSSAHART